MTDQNTNIQQLKNQVSKFTEERNWGQFHNPKNLSMSIAIESSELMEIFQWLNESVSWDIMSSSEAIHLEEELADVMIYCLSLANQLDIDVSTAIDDKIKKNGIKYPITKYRTK
ncbi:nucleotide pyrophosphohydrolase [Clostridium sp. Cult2]|uniref:nucleotide pyrophosphohydrolase n=1 Tax=Clostridium sp. Cult2 TaxID=2079003 RepID=UPI001F180C99|nr:nucleotide pyrophosphohydrolase [Clostridium sp. Cult2]MCF6466552.1 NTP pyrophosphohydrolase [Clostridium sp. Cult2]